MKTITFYSYKGGVGRTLALANIAIRLAEFGRKVCLLDFDLEAPGLQYKFSSFAESQRISKGLVDYIYQFSNTGVLPENISDFTYQFYNSQAKSNITIIPAGDVNASTYWKMLSTINWYDLLYENPSGLSFLLDLKEKIRKEISPDFLLIDSRTGISEISGITLSLLADEVTVVAANNKENLEGARRIMKSISNPNNILLGNAPRVTFVLSRIPFTERPEDRTKEANLISKIKRDFGGLIEEVNVIHSDRELEENEQIKIGYKKDETVAQISRDYLNLFEKLTFNDLSAVEIMRFRDIKDSEWHFQKALAEDSLPKKLEHINKAIELNNTNHEFFIFRALVYFNLEEYNKSLDNCDYILTIEPNYLFAHEIKGEIYFKLKQYDNSEKSYKEILRLNPEKITGYLGMGSINIQKEKFEKALEYFDKAIELDSENAMAFNGRANTNRLLGKYHSALEDVYKALELEPDYAIAFATLAEINAELGNDNEFYLNIENALRLNSDIFETIIQDEKVYESYLKRERFKKILDKYNLRIDVDK